MKLSAHKGIVVIEGTEKEESKIEAIAEKMVEIDSDLVINDGGAEDGEAWATIGYDSRFMTVKEVKEIYKEAKAA